jgi:hypothetical protein
MAQASPISFGIFFRAHVVAGIKQRLLRTAQVAGVVIKQDNRRVDCLAADRTRNQPGFSKSF